MANAIVATDTLIPKHFAEDLLLDADPNLEDCPESVLNGISDKLLPALNAVAYACRNPASLGTTIARERGRIVSEGTTCTKAFDIFISNVQDGD